MTTAMPMAPAGREVRRATPVDVSWLVRELRRFAADYGLRAVSLFPDDEGDVRTLLSALITEGVLLIDTEWDYEGGPERCVGFIGGYWHPHPYNGAVHVLTETFWWTTPSARKAGVGQHLLDAFVAEGRAGGADVISMTVLPGRTPPGVEDALRARGFAEAERVYVLECGAAPSVAAP